jgi:WD40 repeat protein
MRFVVVYDDGRVELRDTSSGVLVVAFDDRAEIDGEVLIALDRSGTRVAFEVDDQGIVVVDDKGTTVDAIGFALGRLLRPLQALDLSADGRELVVSTDGGEAIWYDVDGIDAARIAANGTGFDAQFVADDRVAVLGDNEAQIIDPRSRQQTQRFAFGVVVRRLAVDRTGRLLATIDEDGSIQLWDAHTVALIGAPLRPRNASSSGPIRFSADGRYLLVSGPSDTTWVKVWPADWRPIACSLVTEPLTSFERARYLGPLETTGLCF